MSCFGSGNGSLSYNGIYGVCCRNGSCDWSPPYVSASCGRRMWCGKFFSGEDVGCGWCGVVGGSTVISSSSFSGCGKPPSFASSYWIQPKYCDYY